MRVYTYPGYVNLAAAEADSPKLFRFLKEQGVQLECHPWHGNLGSLPKKPAMIRSSSQMSCSQIDLAKQCAELGHFCFYYDEVLMPNGHYSNEDLLREAKKFIEKCDTLGPDVRREQTIDYLRSTSTNRSTAGETTHTIKQAMMLLDLFETHMLSDDSAASSTLTDTYRALQKNLQELELAYTTGAVADSFMSAAPSIDLFMESSKLRREQHSGVGVIRELMATMLTPLIERLVALGYPMSDKLIEWDYDA